MGISLDKTPPSSPSLASFQHILIRRYRTIFLACVLLLAFSSIYTILVVGSTDFSAHRVAPTELRPVTLQKGEGGRVQSLIPRKIWQIMLPKGAPGELYNVDPEQLSETKTWLAKNIDYEYQLLGPRLADEFVTSNFASNPRLLSAYHSLANMGMKSDLIRYLLLSVSGGVYSDIDTVAIRPIDAWIPRRLRDRVGLVVGIEFDKRDGPNWADIPHDLQFCQWTIAAAPGHPVFTRMVDRILNSLDELSAKHNGTSIAEIIPESFEVMNTTGPAAWTDVVFETLQGFDSSLNETKDLAFMKEARLYGDILVLPIDGFGMGQLHSASTNDGTVPKDALMKHLFWGSWREPSQDAEEENKDDADTTEDQEEAAQQQNGDDLAQQQKAEAERLQDEALRLQEAHRLEQEAARLQEGAQRLQEEAHRQKQEAMQEIVDSPLVSLPLSQGTTPAAQQAETEPTAMSAESSQPPLQAVAATPTVAAEPPPPASPPTEETNAVPEFSDASSEPHTGAEMEEEEVGRHGGDGEGYDSDEVLLVDTGSPAWPGPDWAP